MWVGVDGLLEQTVEEHASGSGGATVEPEGELVEVVGHVLGAEPVVQGAGGPSLEQRGHQVRSGHDGIWVLDLVSGFGRGRGVMGVAEVVSRANMRAPSVWMVAPGATTWLANSMMSRPPGLSASSSRTRPSRPPEVRSTAIVIGALSLDPPCFPLLRPPRKLWSSSTTVPGWFPSSSRSGRTMARRSLCSQAHAVSYDPNPRTSCRPRAETPFFDEVTNHTAANHVDNGVCERWKIVPAVADVFSPHPAHIHRPRPVRHALPQPQRGQPKPSGQRSCPRYSRHVTSSGNHELNSW